MYTRFRVTLFFESNGVEVSFVVSLEVFRNTFNSIFLFFR